MLPDALVNLCSIHIPVAVPPPICANWRLGIHAIRTATEAQMRIRFHLVADDELSEPTPTGHTNGAANCAKPL